MYLFSFGVRNILLFCKKRKENVTRTVLVVCLPPTPSSDVPGLFKAGKASVGVSLSCQSSSTTHWLADGPCFLIRTFLFLNWAHCWWRPVPNLILIQKNKIMYNLENPTREPELIHHSFSKGYFWRNSAPLSVCQQKCWLRRDVGGCGMNSACVFLGEL